MALKLKKSKRNIDVNAVLQVQIIKDEKAPTISLIKMKDEALPLNNLMEKEELNEKHFQNALKENVSIPVPDIVEVSKEDYDKLYPPNYTVPKIRIMIQPHDEKVDYDVDSEDDEWLKANGEALKLTIDDFERYMYFLETTSVETKKVPTLSDLKSKFKKSKLSLSIDATYDYWLNKRLKSKGQALLYSTKKEKGKSGSKLRYDPYVAFRPCRERMHLRKNRARDYDNYCKMLDIRENIEELLKCYKTHAYCEATKLELLKLRFATFQDQYHSEGFNSTYLEKEVQCNTEFLLRDLRENRIGYDMHKNEFEANKTENVEDVQDDVEDIDDEMYPFKRRYDCEYHEIKNDIFDQNYIPESDEKELFYKTDKGVQRKRLGRGGRIIFDRITIPDSANIESDYHQIDFCRNIYVKRCSNGENDNNSQKASPLKLDKNLNFNELEIVCSFDK